MVLAERLPREDDETSPTRERPARPLAPTVLALLLALIAVPLGVGIGLPHVTKNGFTLVAVLGILSLVGGMAAFATFVAVVVRSTRRLVGWPAVLGALLAVALMVWTLGQAVAATNVPRTELGERTPADLGLAYEDVELRATDGVQLSAWYVPSANGAAVVLLHGAGSNRSNVLDHAAVLARHGYGVLLLDTRGHGRSEGRAMDFGWWGDEDIGGAVAFLLDRPDVEPDRIGAVGMSMGGEQAIGASASVEQLRAVVAEGATSRVRGDAAWLSDEYGARGALTEWISAATYGFADLLTDADPPITLHDAVRQGRVSTLLIAAGDVPDEGDAGRYIRSGSPDTVELWVVPDTGHTDALRTHPDEWESRVIAFLDAALDPRG
ncbi:alpha/beta hydrolase [Actinomarinicola tropica]|nr:alpha/beta fold hydrolase [Actinomarinicola tropica]